MDFTVRPATLDDVPALAKAHVDTWREAYAHLLPDEFFTDDLVARREIMWIAILTRANPDDVVRIGEVDGDFAGFAMAGATMPSETEPPRSRQLYMLYTYAKDYGSGLGQALFDAVAAAEPMMLWVAKENPRAIAFYQRNGFAFDGVEQIDPGLRSSPTRVWCGSFAAGSRSWLWRDVPGAAYRRIRRKGSSCQHD